MGNGVLLFLKLGTKFGGVKYGTKSGVKSVNKFPCLQNQRLFVIKPVYIRTVKQLCSMN